MVTSDPHNSGSSREGGCGVRSMCITCKAIINSTVNHRISIKINKQNYHGGGMLSHKEITHTFQKDLCENRTPKSHHSIYN